MQSRLDKLKQKVAGKSGKGDLTTSIYYLIKELKCLPDILGREFEVEYDKVGRIKKIRQLPMKIPALVTLFEEMKKDYEKQEREARKLKRRRK